MKISDVFRKRALFGVAIFCITAIATVGALSIGGNEEDKTPDSLVDLNETEKPGKDQVVDHQEKQPEAENPDVQVGDTAGNHPEIKNPAQVAENPETLEATDKPEVKLPSEVAKEPEGKTQEEKNPAQVAENPEQSERAEKPEQTEVLSPQLIAEQLNFEKSAGLLWPVAGEVVIPYSPDHGVFHYTLEQFSASDAMVLSASVGTQVRAAAKGVVTAIEEDIRTGTTVTLALGNDTSLVYGQLDVTDLKEGDIVEAGECLGTVAEPTRYYVVEGPNLYFKVMESGESINPEELLKNE